MPATASKRRSLGERKRRIHVKSRKGCENCKLRRVKCDETYPRCTKCKLYGVACDYGGSEVLLDSAAQGYFQVELRSSMPQERIMSFERATIPKGRLSKEGVSHGAGVEKRHVDIQPHYDPSYHRAGFSLGRPWSRVSTNATVATMINDSLRAGALNLTSLLGTGVTTRSDAYLEFSEAHLEILDRFQERTSETITDRRMYPAYGDIIWQHASQHTFLMHILIGITLMHDAELSYSRSPALAAQQKFASLQHWDIATRLFNRIISQEMPPSYHYVVWATGVYMVAASFWYMESTKVEDAYPLKPSEPNDLSWAKISEIEGKNRHWCTSDPTRRYSMSDPIVKQEPIPDIPEWMADNDTSIIPECVKRAFGITPESRPANNIWHVPILLLSRYQEAVQKNPNYFNYQYMYAYSQPGLVGLLERKDPYAVCILGWWYSVMVGKGPWWMTRRAKTEREAIQIWLRRNHSELGQVLDFVVEKGLGTGTDGSVTELSSTQEQTLEADHATEG